MTATYFGKYWDVPALEEAEQVNTPIGEKCLHCREEIEDGDQGVMMPYYSEQGSQVVPLHRECQLRMTIGSVGHLNKKCFCYGGDEDDPPGMTKREAAQAAFELFYKRE